MASPQKENGFTGVANELLDNIIKLPLNGTQFKIILLLWRETYGFGRKECKFSDNYVASRLGVKRQNIRTEMKPLERAGIISVVAEPTFSSPRTVSFCKDYDLWDRLCLKKEVTLQECNCITGMELHSITGMQEHSSSGMELHSHRNKPLNKPLKKDIDDFFESVWKLYPKKEGKGQVSKAQKEKLFKVGVEEMNRAIERYTKAKQGTDRKFLQNGSTFFNSGYVDYLDANYQPEESDKQESPYREI